MRKRENRRPAAFILLLIALSLLLAACGKTDDGAQNENGATDAEPESTVGECPYDGIVFVQLTSTSFPYGVKQRVDNPEVIQRIWELLDLENCPKTEEEGTTGELQEPFSFTFCTGKQEILRVAVYANNVMEVTENGRTRRVMGSYNGFESILVDEVGRRLWELQNKAEQDE